MKLRALELEQFRKFTTPVRLEGFGDRVNVLCGPNEFGKSTILAAIRGLMFERHSSKGDHIKRMQSWRGNAAPRLAMDFEVGGQAWRIEKRFLHQPMARLTGPGGVRFDNDAAEETLQRLLGFGAAGPKGARLEHMGVWGALWVTQCQSVQQADLTSELARSSITACLDAEVGVMTGQETGQALMRGVREQRAQLLDGNGKPKGRAREVADMLAAATAKLADLQARAGRLAEAAEEVRRTREALERESDPAAEQRDRAELERSRALREAALLHDRSLEAARAALDLARRHHLEATAEQSARARLGQELAAAARACDSAEQLRAQARGDENLASAAQQQARARTEAAQARAAIARAGAQRARQIVEIVREQANLQEHQAALAAAQQEQHNTLRLAAQLGALRITRQGMDIIRSAGQDLEQAQALLAAQATRIDISLLPGTAGQVSVGDVAVGAGETSRAVVDPTDIVIENLGTLRIIPAIQDRAKIERRLDRARAQRAAALLEAECADTAAAAARLAEREALERALENSRAALQRAAPGNTQAGLAPGVPALREYAALLHQRVQAECAALGLAALPAPPAALAQREAADADDNAASDAVNAARAEADIAGEALRRAQAERARIDAAAQGALSDKARLEQAIAAAEAREPSPALAARLAACEDDRNQRAGAVAMLEQNRPEDTAAGMAARIERYEAALAQRAQTIRRLREKLVGERAYIAQEGGHGLDEQLAETVRARDALMQEAASLARETRILNLLLETLASAEQHTKERYLAPVVRRVTPYLRSLFPGADIACDDDLRITGVTRGVLGAGPATEDFERLSDGTQEQIAVLSRLAFADMLIDQGKPAMVILDDALAYADAARMERMFDILTQASARTQILVFTCREDLFRRLGGCRVDVTKKAESSFL
jgi:DNA repair exonuclease SbcCD ATPase subunit